MKYLNQKAIEFFKLNHGILTSPDMQTIAKFIEFIIPGNSYELNEMHDDLVFQTVSLIKEHLLLLKNNKFEFNDSINNGIKPIWKYNDGVENVTTIDAIVYDKENDEIQIECEMVEDDEYQPTLFNDCSLNEMMHIIQIMENSLNS